jgi:hypothetical protein
MNLEKLNRLRAIECLRGGVPSRRVVEYVPPHQTDIRERFDLIIANVSLGGNLTGKHDRSALLEGNFGTGKSHWLQYFRNEALAKGFICSSVALNKETPLHDIAKLFRQCIEASSAEGSIGSAISQIASAYDTNKAPGFRDMFLWAQQATVNGTLDKRLADSLLVFDRTNDEDVRTLLLREWMGFPMQVADFRTLLREVGEVDTRGITRPSSSNYLQRFEFISRLLVSAGYKGWILLVDELEVVAKYTLLQRAKSYSNLGQLFGTKSMSPLQSVGIVATITTDYVAEVLRGARKNDMQQIPTKYMEGRNQQFVSGAVAGMQLIESERILMQAPKHHEVAEAYKAVQNLYSDAYEKWDAPDVFAQHEYSSSGRMRQYVRSWINAWDLRRIYGYETKPEDVIVEDVKLDYEEDPDRQTEPTDEIEPQPSY